MRSCEATGRGKVQEREGGKIHFWFRFGEKKGTRFPRLLPLNWPPRAAWVCSWTKGDEPDEHRREGEHNVPSPSTSCRIIFVWKHFFHNDRLKLFFQRKTFESKSDEPLDESLIEIYNRICWMELKFNLEGGHLNNSLLDCLSTDFIVTETVR